MIHYFCPDLSLPSGGVKILYNHVAMLNSAGASACIVHRKQDFELGWYDSDVPVKHLESGLALSPGDILVFPEAETSLIRSFCRFSCPKVVFAQSWAYIFPSLSVKENWKTYGIDAVLTICAYINEFVEWSMGIPATQVPVTIDPRLYFNEFAVKDPAIAYKARRSDEGMNLKRLAYSRGGPMRNLQWQALRNLGEEEYAQTLRRTRIFLALEREEGFNLSALEAMASGCLVVGYTGCGGRDFMIGEGERQNCLLVENGDLLGVAQALETVVERFHADPGSLEPIIANGVDTASHYLNRENEKRALVDFYGELISGKNSRKQARTYHM